MAETHPNLEEARQQGGIRRTGPFILGGITSGHGVFHWFTQSFLVMLPEVRDAFLLTELQVGGITSVRELVSGVVALPGGGGYRPVAAALGTGAGLVHGWLLASAGC